MSSQSKRKIRWSNLWNSFGCLPLAIAITFGLMSLFVLYVSISGEISSIRMGRASQQWPRTNGTIIIARVHFGGGRGIPPGHRYDLSYRYKVDGQDYTGYRVRFVANPEVFDEAGDAYEVMGHFRPGRTVPVYYEPGNPANSTLMQTYKLQPFMPIVGLGLLAFAVVMALLTYSIMTEDSDTQRKSRLPP